MKKDKKWAQKEVDRYLSYEGVNEAKNALGFAQLVIGQLDEPETLSQEWIDGNSVYASSDGVTEEYVHVDDLQNLLVPKLELPVIPQFVAKWISEHHEKFDLYPALRRLEEGSTRDYDAYKWYRANTLKFVNAYLTGKYEIEEEQKYIVSDNSSIPLLIKNDSGEIVSYDSQIAYNNSNGTIELTEKEIKDYDERYMTFAKPVEEIEK